MSSSASLKEFEAKLQPGDVLLTRAVKPTTMSRLVSAVQGSEYGHSSLYIGNGQVIDTRVQEGVFKTPLSEVHNKWGGGRDIRAYRLDVSDEDRKKAIEKAKDYLGTPYSRLGALRLVLPAGSNKGTSSDKKDSLICSQLITQAYPDLNVAKKKNRDHVMPVDIARSPLTKLVGELQLEKQSYDEVQQHAFLDELQKLASSKEAGLGDMVSKLRGGPANPFKAGPGIFQRFGNDLMAGGKMVASPQLTAPGKFTPAGAGRRVLGEVAQSAGHHYSHKSTLGNVLNPLGGAIGGVAEGLTRSAGKELHGAGGNVGGRVGGAMQSAGKGLQTVAKPAGMAGEVAGLAGLGSALHAPLSAAGLIGGKVMGAAAHAAPEIGEAMEGAGHVVGHAVHDVVGTASQTVAGRAHRAAGFASKAPALPVTGHSMMPPPMAAGAHA